MPSSGASSDSLLRSFWKARARASFFAEHHAAHQTAALRQLRKLQCSSLRLVFCSAALRPFRHPDAPHCPVLRSLIGVQLCGGRLQVVRVTSSQSGTTRVQILRYLQRVELAALRRVDRTGDITPRAPPGRASPPSSGWIRAEPRYTDASGGRRSPVSRQARRDCPDT